MHRRQHKIPPANAASLSAMDLQGNKSRGGTIWVIQVCTGHAVEPRADVVAPGFDASAIPAIELYSGPGSVVFVQRCQPTAATFFIDATRPRSFTWIVFKLVALHASVVIDMRSKLQARVDGGIPSELELQIEILIHVVGT